MGQLWLFPRESFKYVQHGPRHVTIDDNEAAAYDAHKPPNKKTRFRMLSKSHPEESGRLMALAQQDIDGSWRLYSQLASLPCGTNSDASLRGDSDE